jgi:hypothetical protein
VITIVKEQQATSNKQHTTTTAMKCLINLPIMATNNHTQKISPILDELWTHVLDNKKIYKLIAVRYLGLSRNHSHHGNDSQEKQHKKAGNGA